MLAYSAEDLVTRLKIRIIRDKRKLAQAAYEYP